MAVVQKKYFPKEDLKLYVEKWNWICFGISETWLNLQWALGPWSYPYLVFLIIFLLDIESPHQRHADKPNMKKERKWVVQNQDSETRPKYFKWFWNSEELFSRQFTVLFPLMFVVKGQDHSFLIYFKGHECPGHMLSGRPSLTYAQLSVKHSGPQNRHGTDLAMPLPRRVNLDAFRGHSVPQSPLCKTRRLMSPLYRWQHWCEFLFVGT